MGVQLQVMQGIGDDERWGVGCRETNVSSLCLGPFEVCWHSMLQDVASSCNILGVLPLFHGGKDE